MYGQSVYGTPSGGIEVDDSRNEGRAPREDDDEGKEITTGEMQWRRAGDRKNAHNQQHRNLYQHQGQRHQRQPRDSSKLLQQKLQQLASAEESSSSPSSSLSRTTNPPSSDPVTDESPPGRSTVDKLARKLSKQNLQYGSRFHGQSLPPILPPIMPDLVADDPKPAEPVSAGPSCSYTPHWAPLPSLDMGCAIEVDEEGVTPPKVDDKRLEFRRLRRQASAPLRSATPGGLRAIDARLRAMIANELQCNVRSEPVSIPSASAPSTSISSEVQPAFIEADPDCSMPNWDTLEADDDTADGCEVMPTDDSEPHRHQYVPGGIRKFSVGGVSLRYRLSVDAALRCQNVVKNRPRMRKRDKSRHGSAMSSAMTSAVTSAVNSPVISPATLSSTSFPPPPPPPHPRYE